MIDSIKEKQEEKKKLFLKLIRLSYVNNWF
jgi:hypothetical protein